ncbi:MAG: fibronectin type III domain-containing protein [Bacteroidota bacterium]
MKKLLLSTTFLLACYGASAQDCTAVAPPYSLDFETAVPPALPGCTTASSSTDNNWAIANNPGSGFENKTLQYTGNSQAAGSWFYTQGITLTAGTAYKITYKYGNNSTTTTEKLKVAYGATATATAMTTTIATYETVNSATATVAVAGPFNVTETGTYYFGFNAFSDASQGKLFVDDITIDIWTCDLPTNLIVTGITTTAATLSWNAVTTGAPVQFYQISVQAGTAAAQPGPTVTVTTAPTYFPLTAAATYTVYVRSFCSGTWSDWTTGVTFTTPVCDTFATVPYLLDFETVTAPALPECTIAVAGETGNNWQTTATPGTGFTGNALSYTAADTAADTWFFTKGIELEAGTYYKISYTYGNGGTGTENLSVALATGPGIASVQTPFIEQAVTGGTTTAFVYANPITMATTGIYYLAFKAHSAASQGSLFIDDIKVEEWTCNVPTSILVTEGSVTTTGATLTWTAPSESITQGFFYAYSTTSTPPTDFAMATTPTVTLTGLEPGTTYYFFVKSFCGPLMGEWSEPVTFTTEDLVGITDVAFSSLAVYPNPAKTSFSIKNNTAIDSAVLYNMAGQQLLNVAINSTEAQINIEKLPEGIYMLTAYAGGASKTIKVIRQ